MPLRYKKLASLAGVSAEGALQKKLKKICRELDFLATFATRERVKKHIRYSAGLPIR